MIEVKPQVHEIELQAKKELFLAEGRLVNLALPQVIQVLL